MSFKANGKGIKKLIKFGIPVVALFFGGPIICIIACALVSCIDVEEEE